MSKINFFKKYISSILIVFTIITLSAFTLNNVQGNDLNKIKEFHLNQKKIYNEKEFFNDDNFLEEENLEKKLEEQLFLENGFVEEKIENKKIENKTIDKKEIDFKKEEELLILKEKEEKKIILNKLKSDFLLKEKNLSVKLKLFKLEQEKILTKELLEKEIKEKNIILEEIETLRKEETTKLKEELSSLKKEEKTKLKENILKIKKDGENKIKLEIETLRKEETTKLKEELSSLKKEEITKLKENILKIKRIKEKNIEKELKILRLKQLKILEKNYKKYKIIKVEENKQKIKEMKEEIINSINIDDIFSCNDLYKKGYKKSGNYKIKIRGKKEEKIKVYCDMETSGGGWTLILTSKTAGWNGNTIYSNNSDDPSIDKNYSILNKADFIKSVKGNKVKYRIDAREFGKNGGIWEVSDKYSFISRSKYNTNIKLVEKYGYWKYSNVGIEKRMPYICSSRFGVLSTSKSCISKWYGTLAANSYSFAPAPWIYRGAKNPGTIWYWVK